MYLPLKLVETCWDLLMTDTNKCWLIAQVRAIFSVEVSCYSFIHRRIHNIQVKFLIQTGPSPWASFSSNCLKVCFALYYLVDTAPHSMTLTSGKHHLKGWATWREKLTCCKDSREDYISFLIWRPTTTLLWNKFEPSLLQIPAELFLFLCSLSRV